MNVNDRVALYPVKADGEIVACADTGRLISCAGGKCAVAVGERVVQVSEDKVEVLPV